MWSFSPVALSRGNLLIQEEELRKREVKLFFPPPPPQSYVSRLLFSLFTGVDASFTTAATNTRNKLTK